MKPKTPLPWSGIPSQGTFRMLPEDWEFAVHAANAHEELRAEIDRAKEHVKALEEELLITVTVCNENVDLKRLIAEFIEYASDMNLDDDLMRRALEAIK